MVRDEFDPYVELDAVTVLERLRALRARTGGDASVLRKQQKPVGKKSGKASKETLAELRAWRKREVGE